MSSPVYSRETCRLCGSKHLELAVGLTPTPIGDDFIRKDRLDKDQPVFPLDMMLCIDCGNVQLRNVVNPELIYRAYNYTSSVSLGLVEHFRKYADSVLERVKPPAGALVVELGSNEGAMLRPFKERGFRVLGVDPATEIARRATESGIETMPTYFTADLAKKIKEERGEAAIVIANNVFANIDDVSDVIDGLRYLLGKDGVFVFETSYWLDVEQKMLLDTIFHEHLTYFAVKPLVSFFKRLDMQLFDVERVATKGGSIRGFASMAGSKWQVAEAVPQQVALEDKAGLDRIETYRAYTRQLEGLKAELLEKLRAYKAQGKTIAAYGAAVGLTTMVYYFDLGDLLDFMVDDDPNKQNTFSPGLHIPTLPSDVIYERKPDVIVALAWRYIDPILKKHKTYLDQGGHFLLPLPKVELI